MIKRNGECPYTERIVGEENIQNFNSKISFLENIYTLYIYIFFIFPLISINFGC